MAVNVRPPSFERYKFCEGTYTTSASFGSTKISLIYQYPSIRLSSVAFFHVTPRSSDRNNPPFLSFTSTIRYTRRPCFPGATATPDLPHSPARRPFPVLLFQVTP